ncbi:beta-galactosidase isoform X2 [Nematostella vectensis]|uniref:beta-galactosidase isoform X2 n=1 Tax=Nematostella vectensis TaxID=45351 RepID=UPI0020777F83|nr:beta-galactosidase isoform X2 [Nematostella vectensis]
MAKLCQFVLNALLSFILFLQSLEARSFSVDFTNNVFLKDGKPFRYISGSIHYFRVPRIYWKDRLEKMKFAGLNAVQTYVAWNLHEPEIGTYDFEGENDLEEFIKIAQSVGLLVILRPGPYICGEWELGGFPPWLLKNTSIVLRSSKDQVYMDAVDKWMGVLLPKIRPLLYNNGGPVITVQVENEYGSYFTCDHDYMSHLENLFRSHLGKDVVLFTTDGFAKSMLDCGTLPSLFTTVDFGAGVDPKVPFSILRKYQPNGPLVNSEFYPGWLDHWGEKHSTVNPAVMTQYLDMILAMNASVNLYMFEGGTSFGYMNGANCGAKSSQYQPQPTSYDYDAPLSEAGDITLKYRLLLEVIAGYVGPPSGLPPKNIPKYAYGKVEMKKLGRLLDLVQVLSPNPPVMARLPMTMEQLGQSYGFVLYHTQIPDKFAHQTVTISIPGIRDRAIIYVGKIRQATVIRVGNKTTASIVIGSFFDLSILVENMGRINYGPHLVDPKGILGNVTLGGDVLMDWKMFPLNLKNVLNHYPMLSSVRRDNTSNAPTFFTGEIPPSVDGVPRDTFLYMDSWTKGQVFINGFNVGRYWPAAGPQISLYVPSSVLYAGQRASKLFILELDENPCDYPATCYVTFKDTPLLDGPVAPLQRTAGKSYRHLDQQWLSVYTQENVKNPAIIQHLVHSEHKNIS